MKADLAPYLHLPVSLWRLQDGVSSLRDAPSYGRRWAQPISSKLSIA